MSVVIITGSCGLVGSEASIFFSQKGFKIIGIDNNFRKKFFGSEGSTSWIKKKLFNHINNYEHYSKTPADIKPHNGGYDKRLFKDHHHKTPIKLDIPDNVSNLIYGK